MLLRAWVGLLFGLGIGCAGNNVPIIEDLHFGNDEVVVQLGELEAQTQEKVVGYWVGAEDKDD